MYFNKVLLNPKWKCGKITKEFKHSCNDFSYYIKNVIINTFLHNKLCFMYESCKSISITNLILCDRIHSNYNYYHVVSIASKLLIVWYLCLFCSIWACWSVGYKIYYIAP